MPTLSGEQMRSSILQKLQEINVPAADAEMLAEYTLVLIASKKSSEEMIKELAVFLEDGEKAAEALISWLVSAERESATNPISQPPKTDKHPEAKEQRDHMDHDASNRRRQRYSIGSERYRERGHASERPRGRERYRDDDRVSFTVSLDKDSRRTRYSRTRSRSAERRTIARQELPKSRKFTSAIEDKDIGDEEKKMDEMKLLKRSIPCLYYPNCNLGDACPYSHEGVRKDDQSLKSAMPCKFDRLCKNPACPYIHSSPAAAITSTVPAVNPAAPATNALCRYFPWCGRGDTCAYVHPPLPTIPVSPTQATKPVPCRYGPLCARVDCIFLHPTTDAATTPCRFGSACARPFCMQKHDISPTSASSSVVSMDTAEESGTNKHAAPENITSPPGSPFLLALSDGGEA